MSDALLKFGQETVRRAVQSPGGDPVNTIVGGAIMLTVGATAVGAGWLLKKAVEKLDQL